MAVASSDSSASLAVPGETLHGEVVRPSARALARMAWDGSRYQGPRLAHLERPAPQALPGVVALVQQESFVGVAAVAPILARQAAESLHPQWTARLRDEALDESDASDATDVIYGWTPSSQAHSSSRASVVAWCLQGYATVWLPLDECERKACRAELSALLGWPQERIVVVAMPGMDVVTASTLAVMDAAADAALLSNAVQRPLRMPVASDLPMGTLALRAREAGGERDATHTPHMSDVAGASGRASPDSVFFAETQWAVRPSMARLLSQPDAASPAGYATAQSLIGIKSEPGAHGLSNADAAQLNAAQVFAQESLLDEQAREKGEDPLAYRLRHQPPGPARDLAEQLAERAGWHVADGAGHEQNDRSSISKNITADGHLTGLGFATASVDMGADVQAWSAWVAEVSVNPASGQVDVTRVVVGHDSQNLGEANGAAIERDDQRWIASARELLQAPRSFDDWGTQASAQGTSEADGRALASVPPVNQPALQSTQTIQPSATERSGKLAMDGVMTLPAAAAIANAIHDATGVRLRQVPFDSEQLRLALEQKAQASGQVRSSDSRGWLRRSWGWLAAGVGTVAGLLAVAWPAKAPIAPTAGPDVSIYSAAAIERGRLVAAAGDCVVCHTAPSGQPNAGGLGLETPFGTIYTTNITPDNETGIGRWSYTAFERAMREGVHRDGRQLYPAFPYTSFAKMTDADMQALYGYLMSQPPVSSTLPKTELAFPYSLRPAMAGWNLLFHDSSVYQPDPTQSVEWNRGAYLVQGAGHCTACHSPRNALGAEKLGRSYLGGGEAEGWEAPPLNELTSGKVPWTPDDLYQYLRTGFSARHGVAAGPMAPVIHGLAELPESDVKAIATYLTELPGAKPVLDAVKGEAASAAVMENVVQKDAAVTQVIAPPITENPLAATSEPAPTFQTYVNGERLYQNACAVCHEAGSGPTLFGVKPLLSSNTNLHSESPDNLINVILNGIQAPANGDLGYMPGFRDSLDDEQVADLLGYLRARFAPQQPAWESVGDAVRKGRAQKEHQP